MLFRSLRRAGPRRLNSAVSHGPTMTLTFGRRLALVFGILARLDRPDPSPAPAAWVVGVKGVGFLLAILALAGSLRHAGRSQAKA